MHINTLSVQIETDHKKIKGVVYSGMIYNFST